MRIAFLIYYVSQSHPGRKLRDSENLRSFGKGKNLKMVLNKKTLPALFSTGKSHLEVFWCPAGFNKILDNISKRVWILEKKKALDLQLANKWISLATVLFPRHLFYRKLPFSFQLKHEQFLFKKPWKSNIRKQLLIC